MLSEDLVDLQRYTAMHEQFHAYRVLRWPTLLRPLRHKLIQSSDILTYLEEAAAEGHAMGTRAGRSFPITEGYVTSTRLAGELLGIGAAGMGGMFGRGRQDATADPSKREYVQPEGYYAY